MVPISWRMKRRQLETKHEDAAYGANLKVYPSTSTCSRQASEAAASEAPPIRVKILFRSTSAEQQQGSSGQRFALRDDDRPPGCWRTY